MKKIYILLFITITTLIITIYELNENKKTIKEIKRLEQIIILKEEINKEYVYLFKETKENMQEKIEKEKEITEANNKKISELQEQQKELQNENLNLLNEIEIKQEELDKIYKKQRKIEEEKRIEEKRKIEETTIKIEREITYSQYPEYPTGCESVALKILLEYNDIYVETNEIINRLKKGSLPYEIEEETYGGNPEIEFIGDPTNDYSYGVYNTPIAEVANTFKYGINNKEGLELEEILNIVKENRPVMVWTTINNITSRSTNTWIYRPTGETIYWKNNEHAVVIIGYNDIQVIVSDPDTGRITRYDRNTFKENYNYMGKRAVYY